MKSMALTASGIMIVVVLSSCSHAKSPGSAASAAPTDNQVTTAPSVATTTTSLHATNPSSTVDVTEHDFVLTSATGNVAAGKVVFDITNNGPSSHELLAFRTDLPEDQLPLGPDGRINEDALPKPLDTTTDLSAGTQRSLTVTLAPGRYVLVCNLLNHYKLGMHTVLVVK